MLHREQLAGTRKSGLNFVRDQHNAMFIADLAQCAHQLRRRGAETALPLYRFQNYCGDARGFDLGFKELLQRRQRLLQRDAMQLIGERNVIDLGREWAKTHFVGRNLTGQRHPHHGAAMKTAAKRNHARTSGGGPRNLDRILHCFGAGREQGSFFREIARRPTIDFFSQLHIAGIRHDLVCGMGKLFKLLLDRRNNFRMAMPGVEDGDPTGEINEATPFNIPEFGVIRALRIKITHDTNPTRGGRIFAGLPNCIAHHNSLGF